MRAWEAKKRLLPPPGFKPAGEVEFAELAFSPPPFIADTKPRRRGRRWAGVKYEARVQEHLSHREPLYAPSPWLRFRSRGDSSLRWCQPDGLVLDVNAGQITIVEIKYQHTALAWWQVRQLYEPVLRKLFASHFVFAAIEVVAWLDPRVEFPERWRYAESVANAPQNSFGVHIIGERQVR